MEKISLNLNVNSVAVLLNGFVGEILISVNRVIRNNALTSGIRHILHKQWYMYFSRKGCKNIQMYFVAQNKIYKKLLHAHEYCFFVLGYTGLYRTTNIHEL